MSKQPKVRIPDIDLTDSLTPGDARLLRGNPTEDELAAIAGTLGVMFAAGVSVDRPRDRPARLTPWERTQRATRGGVTPHQILTDRYR
ncbi:acyl-CoA carboxylase subunit epsilon [Gulosibacter sediminis]|uniref:acyl-CoA carboxylase subunit epsilon n=1 Tax=Gulosibacter sediminis TaxID=1729695 RepID=UPI0024AD94F4|nr:acyl-CoA carboxylase subunit epsilon [Gulosibacter sediminis]